ncbi:MAG: M48 family metallopeptidase [Rhodospirillaceae bacterium]|nr:M48 family metallopeptidase [Rhodospirillaceae bacterium]
MMDIEATQAYLATLSPEVLAASKAYTQGGYWLPWAGVVASLIVTLILVRWGVLARLRDRLQASGPRPKLVALIVGAAFLGLSWVLELPWTVYSDWYRETSYELSHQPFADWLMQSAVNAVVVMIMGGLFLLGLYSLIRRAGRKWWLWGGAFAAASFMFVLMISPVFVEPLFNDYTPIPDGPVKEAIVALAKDSGVPGDRIFVYDGSRQRSVLTANVSGFAGSMRIAVSDVALKEATLPEVRAVVAHEIGHYVSGDIFTLIFTLSVLAIVGFFLIDRTFARAAAAMGVASVKAIDDPAGVPVLVFMIGFWLTLCTPITNTLTRQFEATADAYSLSLAKEPDGLATALLKTAEYRDPTPHPIAEALFHSHPSVQNRIRVAMAWKAEHAPAPPAN